jgi:hypothetical protein
VRRLAASGEFVATTTSRCPAQLARVNAEDIGCRDRLPSAMKEVRFAEYRRYEARRVEASNAIMALAMPAPA